jgi:hypothetical protein
MGHRQDHLGLNLRRSLTAEIAENTKEEIRELQNSTEGNEGNKEGRRIAGEEEF